MTEPILQSSYPDESSGVRGQNSSTVRQDECSLQSQID
jgi:hypothetical protein